MINKIGDKFINIKNNSFLLKISFLFYIIGIVYFLSIPYFQESTYINEKQMKASEYHSNDILDSEITQDIQSLYNLIKQKPYKDYKKTMSLSYVNYIENLLKFRIRLKGYLYKIDDNEDILSYKITSPRGDRMRINIVNFIYDEEIEANIQPQVINNILPFFSYLIFITNPEKITWLAKDVIVNLVSRRAFYKKPTDIIRLLDSESIYNQGKKDFILNIDLDNGIDGNSKYVINYSGSNSETCDMDYLKMIIDNFKYKNIDLNYENGVDNVENDMKTRELNKFYKINESIVQVISKIGSIFDDFKILEQYVNVKSSRFDYRKEMVYFIKNIYSIFFVPYRIDSNHLLVAKGINSITIKTMHERRRIKKKNESLLDSDYENENEKYEAKHNNDSHQSRKIENEDVIIKKDNLHDYISFIKSLENITKGISIVEMDIFRGNYNYVMTSKIGFVSKLNLLFLLIFLILYIFFSIVKDLYNKPIFSSKENISRNIIIYLAQQIHIIFMVIVKISFLSYFFPIDKMIILYNEYFNISIICLTGIYTLLGFVYKYSHIDLNAFSFFHKFFIGVMGFNFFFINFGVGLFYVLTIYSNEVIRINIFNLKNRSNIVFLMSLVKILISIVLIYSYCCIMDGNIFYNLITSYNNVYLILFSGLNTLVLGLSYEIHLLLKTFQTKK